MPKKPMQKLKLLYIREFFYTSSDEEHPITVPMIIDMLAKKGIDAERKSIYDDIEQLKFFGDDIISSKKGEYFLGEREFELAEIKLLVDTVSSSKFLTDKKSISLIHKLEQFCSTYQAQTFNNQAFIQSRIKNMNESIYLAVDVISNAMMLNCKVEFKYYHYDENKNEIFGKNGEKYSVSPFALLIEEDKYYLAAYDNIDCKMKHYRVDRIKNVSVSKEKRIGHEFFNKDDYIKVSSTRFSMFNGSPKAVTLRFNNDLSGVVIDRFGKSAMMLKVNSEQFDVNADIFISPQFFGWLFGLGGGVKIMSPQSVVDEYKQYLQNECNLYKQ